jgi:hypothetical protein
MSIQIYEKPNERKSSMPKELAGMTGPGVGQQNIPEIDDLAASYVKERDKRIRQTPREVDSKKALIAALHKHEKEIGRDAEGVLRYNYEGLIIELRYADEKLKVRKADEEEEED